MIAYDRDSGCWLGLSGGNLGHRLRLSAKPQAMSVIRLEQRGLNNQEGVLVSHFHSLIFHALLGHFSISLGNLIELFFHKFFLVFLGLGLVVLIFEFFLAFLHFFLLFFGHLEAAGSSAFGFSGAARRAATTRAAGTATTRLPRSSARA